MNFGNGPPFNPPFTNVPPFAGGMPVFPPPTMAPMTNMPGVPLAMPQYPPGQGPLAGRPVTRGANGLLEAPELEGPEEHEAKQFMKLNPGEEVKYGQFWAEAVGDEEVVGGKEAVEFLGRARKVSKGQLRRIWDIADHRKEGRLGRDEFYIALRLVALAQRGAELSVGGLRNFTGIQLIPDIVPVEREEVVESGKKVEGFSWTVGRDVVERYDAFFRSLDGGNGMIDGKQGVTFFGKSGLPRPTLKKIWDLADVSRDGLLSLQEFRMAMHMVANIRNKKLTATGLPSVLDPNGPNWLRIEGETEDHPAEHGNEPVILGAPSQQQPIAMPPPQATPLSPPSQARASPAHTLSPAQTLSPSQAMPMPPPPQAVPMPPPSAPIAMPPPPQPMPPPAHTQPSMDAHQRPSEPVMAPPPPAQAAVDEARSMRAEAEQMREALRKEREEMERARKEMEQMKAEMDRLRLEKESMTSAAHDLNRSAVSYAQSQSSVRSGSVPPSAPLTPQMAKMSPRVALRAGASPRAGGASPRAAVASPKGVPSPKGVTSPRGGVGKAAIRTQPISLGNDDDDIWDQPSPKASAARGGGGGTRGDSVSSDDDDDFWGGLGNKPTLGPAGGQQLGDKGKGFGGSELDDWVF